MFAVLVIGWAQFRGVRDIQRRSQQRSLRSQQASKQGLMTYSGYNICYLLKKKERKKRKQKKKEIISKK